MQTEIGLQMDGTVRPSGGNTVSSSPMEKWISTDSQMAKSFEFPDSYMIQDQNVNLSLEKYSVGVERAAGHSLCRPLDHDTGSRSNFNTQVASHFMGGYKINTRDAHYENSLFSSSLSELFSRKLRLSSTDPLFGHSFGAAASHYEEDEPFESIEEIEAQTIGNLLPNDDDLLSGVTDRLDYIAQPNNGDDIEELDLFSSVGGMDLGEDGSSPGESNSEFTRRNSNGQLGGSSSSIAGEHPSRTLFVRNINSNVEDSELRSLFERYGDIRTLYTACKHRGFVMISYYDIRAAQNAMKALQDKPLRHRRLDIHFSIPKDNPSEKYINHGTLVIFNLDSSVSNDELHKIFGVYGEIKEIHETPHKSNRKYVEFYDVRDADAVLCVLNGSDIAGKRIKIEPSHPGGARRLVQPYASELEQDESALYSQHSSPPTNLTTSGFSGAVSEGGIMSSSMDNGTILGVHSANGAPVSPFLENAFHHGISSSVPSSLPSLVRVGNQSRVTESVHSQGQRKFEFQGMPNFHPHSLPEYPDGFAGAPGNSPGNLAVNITARPVDRIKNRQFCRVSLNGLDLNEGVFGTSGNGSCPSPGQNYMWSNLHHPQPQGMIWRNSPPFATHPLPQLHGVPRTPSHMLNTLFPISYQHVGSAPSVTSLWDRRHAYAAPDASVFHPGSLGNLGISANTVHPVEPVPHNMFPGSGGNCMDLPFPSTNFGFNSHQRCLIFPTRGQMIPMMNSIDSPNDWTRNCNKPVNKKQFELEIDRIVREEDKRTTLMIKNIPNKYTSKMLLAAIDERHRGTYDFFYLPIDFKNKCNVGYAFINMTDPPLIIPFYQAFNGKKWEKFNSEKVASLAYARIQGKAALIAHFQNSSLMNEDKRCRPILFHTDGPNAGDQVPFPMGVTVRPRPSKNRGSTSEESNQESLPNLANGEKSSNEDSSSGSTKDLD